MKIVIRLIHGTIIGFLACQSVQAQSEIPAAKELIFQSGFEGSSRVIHRGNEADITGDDQTFSKPNSWANLDHHADIGNFSLQYQGGDSTMRYAKIIAEPGKPGNKVLHFWLNEPNVEGSKGRIQANLYGNKGMASFYQSVRVFLTNDLETVKKYPKEIHWLTLAEFWNNVTWSQTVPYGFRITLGIGKSNGEQDDLHFILDAEDCELSADGKQKYTKVWVETNQTTPVPIGKWFTMDYYYKEGNGETGRVYLAIQPDGGKKEIIFNVRNFTHSTHDPKPDGVTDFNPMKLYTSKDLIGFMRSQGKTLQIYWDDFKLWKGE
jgi:hypothetical protein